MTPEEQYEQDLGMLATWIDFVNGTPVEELTQSQDGRLKYHEIESDITTFKHYIQLLKIEAIKLLPRDRFLYLFELLKPIFNALQNIQGQKLVENLPSDQQKQNHVNFFHQRPISSGRFKEEDIIHSKHE